MNLHLHVRRHVADIPAAQSIEFSDLLDPIGSTSSSTPFATPAPAPTPVAPIWGSPVDADMAFADMLVEDVLVADTALVAAHDLESLLVEVPAADPEPLIEPVAVSRFADAGVDDDRLPLNAAPKRFRLR